LQFFYTLLSGFKLFTFSTVHTL